MLANANKEKLSVLDRDAVEIIAVAETEPNSIVAVLILEKLRNAVGGEQGTYVVNDPNFIQNVVKELLPDVQKIDANITEAMIQNILNAILKHHAFINYLNLEVGEVIGATETDFFEQIDATLKQSPLMQRGWIRWANNDILQGKQITADLLREQTCWQWGGYKNFEVMTTVLAPTSDDRKQKHFFQITRLPLVVQDGSRRRVVCINSKVNDKVGVMEDGLFEIGERQITATLVEWCRNSPDLKILGATIEFVEYTYNPRGNN